MYIRQLEQEHEWIEFAGQVLLSVLNRQGIQNKKSLEAPVRFLCEFGVGYHLASESKILYPEIQKLRLDLKDGPRCVDVSGRVQMWAYSKELSGWMRNEIIDLYHYALSQKQGWFAGLSPTDKKLDEFRVCECLSRLLLAKLSSDDGFTDPKALKAAHLLVYLFKDHVTKQGDCLLAILEKKSTPERLSQMELETIAYRSIYDEDVIMDLQREIISIVKKYELNLLGKQIPASTI